MKVNKIPIRPNKIGIDLILCPKTNLYLQDLYCRRCAYYELDSEKFVECGFTGHRFGKTDPIKDRIIKDLSKAFITDLPIESNDSENLINGFAERLQKSKSLNTENQMLKKDLSQYIKKTNLSTRLENIKKAPLKKEKIS
ncbi:MAG: hypothetical protein ACXABO_14505 [Promethearchaeota archaeon]|jgi:hypothetical protein